MHLISTYLYSPFVHPSLFLCIWTYPILHFPSLYIRYFVIFPHRLDEWANASLRKLTTTYYTSFAPINDYIIQEGQGQTDCCFSQRMHYKSAQVPPTHFLVWNFDKWGVTFQPLGDDSSLNVHFPIFLSVRILDIHSLIGKKSLSVPARNRRDTAIRVACFVFLTTASFIRITCLITE